MNLERKPFKVTLDFVRFKVNSKNKILRKTYKKFKVYIKYFGTTMKNRTITKHTKSFVLKIGQRPANPTDPNIVFELIIYF